MNDNLKIEKLTPNPIYRQIAEIVKEKIVSGDWEYGTKLPSEAELAEKFGTSRITLRKSFKILEAQKLLLQQKGRGTFVAFKRRERFRIAVSLDIQQYDYYSLNIFAGLMKSLQMDAGQEVVFLGTGDKSSILQAFHDVSCDGLIAVAPHMQLIKELCRPEFDDIPLVFLHAGGEAAIEKGKRRCVDLKENGISLIMEHLVSLGHRKFAFITAPAFNSNLNSRIDEYKNCLKKYHIDPANEFYFTTEANKLWYNYAKEKTFECCSGPSRPTAIICTGRSFSYGAVEGAIAAGLKIPEDISIAGFDCEITANPNISTIVQPFYEMAQKAAELVLDLLNGRNTVKSVLFKPTFQIRGSTSIQKGKSE